MKTFLLFAGAAICLSLFSECNKNDDDSATKYALEAVYSDNDFQFTGVAKDPAGDKMFVNYPRWSGPYRYGLVAATGLNTSVPFPDAETNMWQEGQDGENKWVCVQSVYFDDNSNLWVLDPAAPNMEPVRDQSHKLVRINKVTGEVEKRFEFDSVAGNNSYLNDIRIDVARQFAYITNSKEGGIVIVDLNSGHMRQVLQGHYSVISDPSFKFIIDGRELKKNGQPAKFNSDGIALTPDGNWLYYKPTTDDKLYRIQTEYLRDFTKSSAVLGSLVEDLGHKCVSDGMIFDSSGNLYLGDMQNYSIVKIDPANNHEMTTLIKDPSLIWPDSYSISGGYLYISCSQINLQPDYNDGANRRTTPYQIFRMKL